MLNGAPLHFSDVTMMLLASPGQFAAVPPLTAPQAPGPGSPSSPRPQDPSAHVSGSSQVRATASPGYLKYLLSPSLPGPPTLHGVAECLIPSDGSACTACVPPLPAMGTFSGVHDNTQSPQCPTSMGGANETKPGAILYNKVLFFFPFDKKH